MNSSQCLRTVPFSKRPTRLLTFKRFWKRHPTLGINQTPDFGVNANQRCVMNTTKQTENNPMCIQKYYTTQLLHTTLEASEIHFELVNLNIQMLQSNNRTKV